jgi:hypothetical protein
MPREYANKRHRPLEFEVRDHVYLKVLPMKGVKRFGVKGKLAPRYVGPFPILEKYGTVAYELELPPSLGGVHDIFHVSQLKKCLKAPVDVVLPEVTPIEVDLTYSIIRLRSWIRRIVSLGARPLNSSRFNGATIQKQKLLGKVRNHANVRCSY